MKLYQDYVLAAYGISLICFLGLWLQSVYKSKLIKKKLAQYVDNQF